MDSMKAPAATPPASTMTPAAPASTMAPAPDQSKSDSTKK
jgi:hypothetical protein